MNSFILIIFFSATLMAQESGLVDETYNSKKNMFENKHAEVNDAYKEYWEAKKNVQLYDTEILNKEKNILSTKVRLENVERALHTEKKLKQQIKSTDVISKETVFVKSGNDFITVDVNDPKHFAEPEANATKICLKDQTRCFPFKTENGKKVLSLNRQEIMIELQNLRTAKSNYIGKIYAESEKRDALIENRPGIESQLARSEKKLDKKKKSLFELFNSKKAGIDEAFVDKLITDANKENFFGATALDPVNPNSKGQMWDTLNNKVFGKDTYGLLKEKSDEYQEMDNRYAESYTSVSNLKTNYNLDAPSLTVVSPSVYTFPDASLLKRVPSSEVTVTALVKDPENEIIPEKINEVVQDNTRVVVPEIEQIVTPEITKEVVVTEENKEVAPIVIPKLDEEICKEDEENCKKDEKEICKEDDEDCKKEEPTIVKEEKTVVETPEELCAKEAVAKILELFKDDKQDILGKQFGLTAMKTALYLKGKAAPGSVPVSMEQAINNDQANLAKEEKIQELKKIYEDHGLTKAAAGMDGMVEKMKAQQFNYFSSTTRMTNDEASNLYLLLSKSDSPVKFGMEDAAVTWAFGQMNQFQKGTEAYNRLNMSTHVNKMMSVSLAGGTNMSVEKLESATKETEKIIDDAIAASLQTISTTCQAMFADNCVLVSTAKQDAFAEMIKTILSKQETQIGETQIQDYHIKAQNFIGRPSEADYRELGKGHLKKDIPAFLPAAMVKVQVAAGKTVFTRKPQSLKIDGKCYATSYESGKVGVTESVCK